MDFLFALVSLAGSWLLLPVLLAVWGCTSMIFDFFKFAAHKSLFERVSWCVAGDSSYFYSTLGNPVYGTAHLLDKLFSPKSQNHVSEPYRIKSNNSTEKEYLQLILNEYKTDLAHAYFQNRLSHKHLGKLSATDYFFLTLDQFLSRHECDRDFFNQPMYDLLEREYFDDNGEGGHSDTSRLTDFGTVYIKLRYLTFTYCIATPALNSNHVSISAAEYLKEELDTGIARFSYYRP